MKKPKPITHFPSQDVDIYLKNHGHLPPQEKCTLSLCDEHEAMQCEVCKCKICNPEIFKQ